MQQDRMQQNNEKDSNVQEQHVSVVERKKEVPVLIVSSLARDISQIIKCFDNVFCHHEYFPKSKKLFDIEEHRYFEQVKNEIIVFRVWNTGFKHAVSVRQALFKHIIDRQGVIVFIFSYSNLSSLDHITSTFAKELEQLQKLDEKQNVPIKKKPSILLAANVELSAIAKQQIQAGRKKLQQPHKFLQNKKCIEYCVKPVHHVNQILLESLALHTRNNVNKNQATATAVLAQPVAEKVNLAPNNNNSSNNNNLAPNDELLQENSLVVQTNHVNVEIVEKQEVPQLQLNQQQHKQQLEEEQVKSPVSPHKTVTVHPIELQALVNEMGSSSDSLKSDGNQKDEVKKEQQVQPKRVAAKASADVNQATAIWSKLFKKTPVVAASPSPRKKENSPANNNNGKALEKKQSHDANNSFQIAPQSQQDLLDDPTENDLYLESVDELSDSVASINVLSEDDSLDGGPPDNDQYDAEDSQASELSDDQFTFQSSCGDLSELDSEYHREVPQQKQQQQQQQQQQ